MKILYVLLLLTTLVGCTPTIVERNFEAEEAAYIKKHGIAAKDPFYAPATPDYVVAGSEDHVLVTLFKDVPENYRGMQLQTWQASVFNHNDYPVCVLVQWKLMDFEMFSDYSDFTLIPANQQLLHFATMKQQIWNLDGTEFALPPSGYIHSLVVKEPNKNVKRGQECVFESEVEEI